MSLPIPPKPEEDQPVAAEPAAGPAPELSSTGGADAMAWPCFVGFATVTQLAFKLASKPLEHLDFGPEWLAVASGSPAFALAVACYIATFALWIVILQRTPLSRAFLLTALVYVTVTLGSALWLGESINLAQLAGIGLIAAGVALLGFGGRDWGTA